MRGKFLKAGVMVLKFRPNLFNHEIGIDIGTVNTVIRKSSKWASVNSVNSKFTTEMISDTKNKRKKRRL